MFISVYLPKKKRSGYKVKLLVQILVIDSIFTSFDLPLINGIYIESNFFV